MAAIPRLNGVIKALESGQVAITTFVSPPTVDNAIAVAGAAYDGAIFEAEHSPYDIGELRDGMQYMLSRRQIVDGNTLAPAVTPLIRVPCNGSEMNEWMAKQALDIGAYGIVWPRVSTVEEAWHAVAACRYPRPPAAAAYEPAGLRGDFPANAARYWGLTPQEYYPRADVWPLVPAGEILVVIMCEDVTGIDNLPRILKEVPGVGVVLSGEGDLSQNLGYPRQPDHPAVIEGMAAILRICTEHNVPCGRPRVDGKNAQQAVDAGYRFLMAAPVRSFAALDACRQVTKSEGP
jgi:4-hydroxy-2-oxoheptanedioate aldolase